MPDDVFDMYFNCLGHTRLESGLLLDVGAGPGLQMETLLKRLPLSWNIVGLEPSRLLASSAKARLKKFGKRALIRRCRFEDLSMSRTFDAAWMSEVVHLLGSVSGWTHRLADVLQPEGRILIRTSTHEQLHKRYWYRFFPAALDIDLARHPTKASIFIELAQAGFSNISAETIDESRWITADLLLGMMRERAFSTLHYLSQMDLDRGVEMMSSELADRLVIKWHYEMTAYTATYLGGK